MPPRGPSWGGILRRAGSSNEKREKERKAMVDYEHASQRDLPGGSFGVPNNRKSM